MRSVNLAAFVLHAHSVGILAVNSCMTPPRAVTTESNAITVVNGVSDLTAPHALLGVASALFSNTITERGTDLLDLRSRE